MAVLPARFPRTEAELADWSVYADQLLLEGDPLGNLIARELALPAELDAAQIADYKNLVAPRLWKHPRKAMAAGWAFGFMRELHIWAQHQMMSRQMVLRFDDGLLANVCDLLHQPNLQRLDRLVIGGWLPVDQKALRRMFAALPPSCVRVHLDVPLGRQRVNTALPRLAELLPPHVTQLSVAGEQPFDYPSLIDDRFETVELHGVHEETIVAALSATARVKVRVLESGFGRIHERIALLDGPGLIQTSDRRADHLRPLRLTELERYGAIPIRSQLARTLPAYYQLVHGHPLVVPSPRSGAIRAMADQWSLRAEGANMRYAINGRELAIGERVPLADGDVIGFDTHEVMFVTHDLVARVKALA